MLVIISHFLIEIKKQQYSNNNYSSTEINIMNSIWLDQLKTELQHWCQNHLSATNSEIQDAAERIQKTMKLILPEISDPILDEAIEISKERIMTKLKAEKLTLIPAELTLHATELAQREDIRALAKTRVQAKLRAAREMLQ